MNNLRKAYYSAVGPHKWDDANANKIAADRAIGDAEREIEALRGALSYLLSSRDGEAILPSSHEGMARSNAKAVLASPSCL